MHNINLNIETGEPKWNNCSDDIEDLSKQILKAVFDYVKKNENIDFLSFGKPISVGLALSNDTEIKKLNRDFGDKDSATNVLSFASVDDENFYDDIELFKEIELGDIIISFDTLEKEAKEKNISFINHYTHLFIHGILHLLGFDHIKDDEADYMEDFEINILKTFNINNPYAE
ncbi:MAG: rRNA maturation RNase YbeY [Lactobacillaceae bacterium]|jgi:probable rRNA maturation factor|nr:rRNA maturation RNase YbeY [Lactobacillaceae bacterium]